AALTASPVLAVVAGDDPIANFRARDLGASACIAHAARPDEFKQCMMRTVRRHATHKDALVKSGPAFANDVAQMLDKTLTPMPIMSLHVQCDRDVQDMLGDLPETALQAAISNRIRPLLPDRAIMGLLTASDFAVALPALSMAQAKEVARSITSEIEQAPLNFAGFSDAVAFSASSEIKLARGDAKPHHAAAGATQSTARPTDKVGLGIVANRPLPMRGIDASALAVVKRRAQQLNLAH
ncbi:MAG: hypothetical protein AAF386_14235, partial [Pseudomonadota bacterium]